NRPVPPFTSGTTAQLVCELGSVPRGPQITTCRSGVWEPPSIGICSAASGANEGSCEPLPKMQGGKATYSELFNPDGPVTEGTTAKLSCDSGWSVSENGAVASVCQRGKWSPELGTCDRLRPTFSAIVWPTDSGEGDCPPPKSRSPNATLEFNKTLKSGGYPNGTVLQMSCPITKQASRGQSFEAQCVDGKWTPEVGVCEEEASREAESDEDVKKAKQHFRGPGSCQPIATPLNGRISYIQAGQNNNYEIGSTAILNCELGYIVNGTAALSCTPTGWQPFSGFGRCVLNSDLFSR
ncbi:Protein F36H2.5, partial [Aphelenchoides avenae]